jgi:NitT/TauT family transport system substrate-binding protein
MGKHVITRRGFLGALGAGVLVVGSGSLLAACSGSAASKSAASKYDNTVHDDIEDLTVALLGKDIKIACILIAKQEGLYEKEKLNVKWQTTTGFDVGMPALSKGDIDVMPFGVIPSCTYIGQGDDLVMFGGTVAQGSEALTLKANKDKYKTAADFKGAKIGCFRMETGHMVMKGWLREQGLNVDQDDPNKDVTFTYLESSTAEQAAVENGAVDMAFVNSGYGYVALKSDKVAVAFQAGDFVKDFPCCRQTANRNAFETKRSALIKFEIANLAAYAILQNDHAKAIADLAAYSGQPEAYVENVIYGTDTYKPAMIIEMDPYTDRCVDFYGTMIDNGDIKNKDKELVKANVDSSIYKAALDEMVTRGQDADLYKKLLEDYKSHNTLGF